MADVSPATSSPLSVSKDELVEPLSKNRRRKNARLAAKARAAAEKASLLDVPTDLQSALALEVVDNVSTDKTESTACLPSVPQKKAKNRSKVKRQKSDPARLMSPLKNKCQHEEKIAKALENRELILLEKSEKVRQQTKKVEEVRQVKAASSLHQIKLKENLCDKMQRAEKKRELQLSTIKIRARDEATKVDEINFINSVKSQNRIMDVMEKEQKVITRQQIIEEERTKRHEENKARDAAVEDRRRQQEQERAAKLSEMEERKRIKVKKVEQHVSDRLQQVRDKARDRAIKLSAIEEAQKENLKSLREKIQKKAEVSTRLHEERMELKRLRAQYLRSPRPGSADSVACLPDYLVSNRCRSHTGDTSSPRKEQDVKEKIDNQIENSHIASRYEKIGRKLRLKLLKQDVGMDLGARESRLESGDVSQALEILDCLKYATGWSAWNTQLEPCLERLSKNIGVASRSKDKSMADELRNGALRIVHSSVSLVSTCIEHERSAPVPEKPLCAIYNLLSALLSCQAFDALLVTNVFVGIVEQAKFYTELLVFGVQNGKPKVHESVFDSCFRALESILRHFDHICRHPIAEHLSDHVTDFVRYFLTCGLIQMIGRYHVLQLHHEDGKLRYLRKSFQFTTWISRLMSARKASISVIKSDTASDSDKDLDACVQYELLVYRDILKSAPVFGSVTLLYDLLRLGRSRPRCLESCQAEIPEESYRVAVDIIKMLNYIGNADLVPLQTAFRDLTLSIQFRHICSFLIDHCLTFHGERAYLLHDVVLLIGQFAFLSSEHQDIIIAGHPPNVLQQLARFPVEYLTVRTLQDILLPTLIICGFQNRKNCSILAEEMDLNHLTIYIKDNELNPWPPKDLDRNFRLAMGSTKRYMNVFHEHCDEDFLRYSFENRFPRSLWTNAANFFYVSSVDDINEPVIDHLRNNSSSDPTDVFQDMCLLLPDGGTKYCKMLNVAASPDTVISVSKFCR